MLKLLFATQRQTTYDTYTYTNIERKVEKEIRKIFVYHTGSYQSYLGKSKREGKGKIFVSNKKLLINGKSFWSTDNKKSLYP